MKLANGKTLGFDIYDWMTPLEYLLDPCTSDADISEIQDHKDYDSEFIPMLAHSSRDPRYLEAILKVLDSRSSTLILAYLSSKR